ncbi:MAG: glycine--tRNA ligase, partial [Verrucomicrobia bacterium]
MAERKENPVMEKIVSLCKRRGFIFQSSEIYGGLNGFWDYGPLGAELKRNVKELWWRSMTQQREDVVGLEASIIMHPKIWEASGHTSTFSDPMVDCLGCKRRFRADQTGRLSGTAYHYKGASDRAEFEKITDFLRGEKPALAIFEKEKSLNEIAEEWIASPDPGMRERGKQLHEFVRTSSGTLQFQEDFSVLVPHGKPPESAQKKAREFYQQRGVKDPLLRGERTEQVDNSVQFCPECGCALTPPRQFNLMFKTHIGPVESEENVAYLRPETAQAIFAQFKTVLEVSRQKIPFGIAQIGKAFRNEINPRNFTFRSREFEQMELEFFIRPDEAVEAIAGRVASASEIGNRKSEIGNSDWGWEAWHKYWVEQRIAWYESIGLPRASLEEYWQKKKELAHYARATVDILYKFPFG